MSQQQNSGPGTGAQRGMHGKYRRRIFIVDARLQFKIVLHLFLLSALIGVLGALLASLYFLHLMASHPKQDPNLHLEVLFLGLSVATSALLIIAVVGIFISHGIAGPMYRFRQVMRAVIEKREVPPVTLRRHDYLHGMTEDFEALLAALRGETAAAARTAREASAGIARTVAALKASGKADAPLLDELAEIQGRLAQAAEEAAVGTQPHDKD